MLIPKKTSCYTLVNDIALEISLFKNGVLKHIRDFFIMKLTFKLPFPQVVQEYERAVIFRLGRLLKGGAKGPGIFFVIPCIDSYRKIDLRTVSFDVPPQEVRLLSDKRGVFVTSYKFISVLLSIKIFDSSRLILISKWLKAYSF